MTDQVYIEQHNDTHCLIKAKLAGENIQKLSEESWPGFAKWLDGTRFIRFRPTANNIKYIHENWPNAIWHKGADRVLSDFIMEQKAAADTAKMKTQHIEDDGSYEYKTKPYDHQRHAFLLSRDKPEFAFFMEQGTGKSKVAIDSAVYAYSQGTVEALVIIAPNGVHSNWVEIEIPAHLPDWCPYSAWTYTTKVGSVKREQAKFEEALAAEDKLKIFAFNVEGFGSKHAQKCLERIIRTFKTYCVIDESQHIKNHSAKRTNYLTKVGKDMVRKRIMTGTNITKGVQDLYGQMTFLNDNILGFDTFGSFRGHFCSMGGYKSKNIVGYKNIPELIDLLDGSSFRVLKTDCLDLPEKIYKRWHVELTPQQRKHYNELKNDYYTYLEEHGSITADIAVVRLIRLQQIMCGWFPADDGELSEIPGGNPRQDAVMQHCENTQGAVLVWCRFKEDIRKLTYMLKEQYGRGCAEAYFGETSTEDRIEYVKEFQAGNLKAMVCSKAASRGLTLTKCEDPFIHSNDFDLEVRLQLEDRCHRIGTVGNVTYTDCEAKNTIDRKIINALRSKKIIADLVNQDPENFFMEEAA